MKKCVIIGACECDFSENDLDILKESVVVCADGGYKTALKYGIKPDYTIGDFDSLGYIPDAENVITHNAIKDDTDTALCVEKAIELGCDEFYIYGAASGRIDHSFANFQLICNTAKRGKKVFLISDVFFITAVSNGALNLKAQKNGIVSVFCMGEGARGVCINGLKYVVCDCQLSPFVPLGVSNEFIGKCAEISVSDGVLLIMVERRCDIGDTFYI